LTAPSASSWSPAVELRNADGASYAPRSFALAERIEPYEPGDWGNYAKAAVQSLVELAMSRGRRPHDLQGMLCLVDSDIPSEAGLSSSTAMVVGSALAFARANGLRIARRRLAERMAEAEHYVGTRGGGMDQAACLLAGKGEALKIDFFPLRTEAVPFPPDCCIVAAHSTVFAKKTGGRRDAYNRRVVECGVGAHILARALGLEPPKRLADVAKDRSETGLGELAELLRQALGGREALSLQEAAALCEMDEQAFRARFLTWPGAREPGGGFRVLPRCRHVFTEAARTERAAECLRQGRLEELGRLMDQSHESCARDYEISCPELDELTALMRTHGALGARLTGAGFGGFAIGLVRAAGADRLKDALALNFYSARGSDMKGNVFVFRPAEGARVERLL